MPSAPHTAAPWRHLAQVRIKVELDNTPQDDQQFDIDGTGMPSVAPTIVGCTNLEPVEADCKLMARYSMLNVFEGKLRSGLPHALARDHRARTPRTPLPRFARAFSHCDACTVRGP